MSASLPQRTERDALGEVILDGDCLYGIQTARSLVNLSFSGRTLGDCPPLVGALACVKRAAAAANLRASVLDEARCAAITQATQELLGPDMGQHLPADLLAGGGSIAINMSVNEVLANLANRQYGHRPGTYDPVDPIRHVNASQSTADVGHTAVRLAILGASDQLTANLEGLTAAFAERAATFAGLPTLARTCLRDGLPTTVDVLLGAWAEATRRRTRGLVDSTQTLLEVSLGGTVIGTGEAAPVLYRDCVVGCLAETTGRPLRARPNRSDALQHSDDIVAVSAQLEILAQLLLKIAQDLRLLGSGPKGGFGEVILPHVQAGSSFFAGKSNPVVPETMMQCAFQVFACHRAVQAAAEHAELHLNVFDGLAAVNILDAIAMLTAAVGKFDEHCIRGLRFDEERCRALSSAVKSN